MELRGLCPRPPAPFVLAPQQPHTLSIVCLCRPHPNMAKHREETLSDGEPAFSSLSKFGHLTDLQESLCVGFRLPNRSPNCICIGATLEYLLRGIPYDTMEGISRWSGDSSSKKTSQEQMSVVRLSAQGTAPRQLEVGSLPTHRVVERL